jgi:hypothetical protein
VIKKFLETSQVSLLKAARKLLFNLTFASFLLKIFSVVKPTELIL